MALMDEFQEERARMKEQPFLKRLAYFWEYNKLPVMITLCVVIMLSGIIYHNVTKKEVAFSVALIDCLPEEESAAAYEAMIAETLGIDTSKEEVCLDASYLVSGSSNMADNSLSEALSVRVATGEIDAFVSGETFFSAYAVGDVFVDLRTILTEEQIALYEDDFYYIDYARIENGEANQLTNDIKHLTEMQPSNPETMENPVPIGIYVTPTEEFNACYTYSKKESMVFGIIYNHCDPNYITTFLNILTGRTS